MIYQQIVFKNKNYSAGQTKKISAGHTLLTPVLKPSFRQSIFERGSSRSARSQSYKINFVLKTKLIQSFLTVCYFDVYQTTLLLWSKFKQWIVKELRINLVFLRQNLSHSIAFRTKEMTPFLTYSFLLTSFFVLFDKFFQKS